MVTQVNKAQSTTELVITWEPLPKDFELEDDPVDNEGQPLLAGALRESLELSGFIQPEMLIVSNFGLCATVNGQIVVKAPDWLYVDSANPVSGIRRSYTPQAEGNRPTLVMEFLSETPGNEYSVKRTPPLGKWFFYEQILQVPFYAIFEPEEGLLEFHQLQSGRYEPMEPTPEGRYWIDEMQLFLGVWQGSKENLTGYWLRWWDAAGNILPWALEKIEQERQRADEAHQRADEERQRADEERQRADAERQRAEQESQQKERLMAYLRSQGIDPDNLPSG